MAAAFTATYLANKAVTLPVNSVDILLKISVYALNLAAFVLYNTLAVYQVVTAAI